MGRQGAAMSRKPNSFLQSAEIDRLVTLVEEAARSSGTGVKRFIEPAQGTLRRAVSKRHHLVFGRRGSGKSSLLRKAAADLTVQRRPIAYVDLEAFKAHSYPDVLLSILIKTFYEFERWLETAATFPLTRTTFWKRMFGTAPERKGYQRREVEALAGRIKSHIAQLETQLHSADGAVTETMLKQTEGDSIQTAVSGKLGFLST